MQREEGLDPSRGGHNWGLFVFFHIIQEGSETFVLRRKTVSLVSDHRPLLTETPLLGLDDNKLTYSHFGRFKQLSQFDGKVIDKLIA